MARLYMVTFTISGVGFYLALEHDQSFLKGYVSNHVTKANANAAHVKFLTYGAT
jgi:hypothetical protein